MKRTTRIIIIVALLALLAPGALWAQAGDLSLEGLAEYVRALQQRVGTNEKRLAALETAIAPAPTLTATATVTPTPTAVPGKPAATIGRRMNVRRGPGTHHDIIGAAEQGKEFAITGRNLNGDWWQIAYEGRAGWVYAPYTTASDPDGVQVVATPTPLPTATPRPTPFPTATPRPTSTPVPSAGASIGSTEAAAALLVADFLYDPSAWQRLTEAQQGAMVIVYQSFVEFAADHCDLSYEDAALLVDSYADVLDVTRFTDVDGTKPRGYLMAFLWGFAKDGVEDLEAAGVDCDYILETAVYLAVGR